MKWYVGQQVYCLRNGEGVIEKIDTADGIYKIEVQFTNVVCHYRGDGRISTTEATPMLYAAKPEIIAPKWHPKEGEWCWFWDDRNTAAILAKFHSICTNELYRDHEYDEWQNCAPFIGELPEHLKEVEK